MVVTRHEDHAASDCLSELLLKQSREQLDENLVSSVLGYCALQAVIASCCCTTS